MENSLTKKIKILAAMGLDKSFLESSSQERQQSITNSLEASSFVTITELRLSKTITKNTLSTIELVDNLFKDREAYYSLVDKGETVYSGTEFNSLFGFVGEQWAFNFIWSDKLELGFWLYQHIKNIGFWVPSLNLMLCFREDGVERTKAIASVFTKNLSQLVDSMQLDVKAKTSLLCSYSRPFHFFHDILTAYYNFKLHVKCEPHVVLMKDTTFFDAFSESDPQVRDRVFENEDSLNRWLVDNKMSVFRAVNDFNERRDASYYQWVRSLSAKVSVPMLPTIQKKDFVLWLGICAEKRTWLEMPQGIEELISFYAKKKKKLTVILDGLTRSEFEERNKFISKKARKDFEFAEQITKKFPHVRFVNSVGFSAKEKISLAQEIDFFVTNFLTDSMYVARFAEKPGVAYGALGTDVSGLRHPRTYFLPYYCVRNVGKTKGSWATADYSIEPQKLIDFCDKVDTGLKHYKPLKKLLSGDGFNLEYDSSEEVFKIKSKLTEPSFICLGEGSGHKFYGLNTCTATAHAVEVGEKYLFRFEAFTNLGVRLFVIGYKNGKKVFTEYLPPHRQKYITFPKSVDKFRLFIRLAAGDELQFYDVFWSSKYISACTRFSINYKS